MLWNVFGFKRENVTGHWRKLHSEELNDLYMSQNIIGNQIKEEEMSRVCGIYGGRNKMPLYFGRKT
jgi:hypothetical protein